MNSNLRRLELLMPGELNNDFRARLALEQAHAAERREHELAEQTSVLNTPGNRIRIWEQLHALTLPSDAGHPLLKIIASDTDLTMDQVQSEQRERSNAAAARKDAQPGGAVWDPYCMLSGKRP